VSYKQLKSGKAQSQDSAARKLGPSGEDLCKNINGIFPFGTLSQFYKKMNQDITQVPGKVDEMLGDRFLGIMNGDHITILDVWNRIMNQSLPQDEASSSGQGNRKGLSRHVEEEEQEILKKMN
jgi:hypothetical protein